MNTIEQYEEKNSALHEEIDKRVNFLKHEIKDRQDQAKKLRAAAENEEIPEKYSSKIVLAENKERERECLEKTLFEFEEKKHMTEEEFKKERKDIYSFLDKEKDRVLLKWASLFEEMLNDRDEIAEMHTRAEKLINDSRISFLKPAGDIRAAKNGTAHRIEKVEAIDEILFFIGKNEEDITRWIKKYLGTERKTAIGSRIFKQG